MEKKNIKTVTITLSRVYNNPTFDSLLGRFDLKVNQPKMVNVNHSHYSDLVRMSGTFNFTITG
jgi:hypothetical protein